MIHFWWFSTTVLLFLLGFTTFTTEKSTITSSAHVKTKWDSFCYFHMLHYLIYSHSHISLDYFRNFHPTWIEFRLLSANCQLLLTLLIFIQSDIFLVIFNHCGVCWVQQAKQGSSFVYKGVKRFSWNAWVSSKSVV